MAKAIMLIIEEQALLMIAHQGNPERGLELARLSKAVQPTGTTDSHCSRSLRNPPMSARGWYRCVTHGPTKTPDSETGRTHV